MYIKHNNLTIRNAGANDASILCGWWNDGKVMAHTGFPNGLGTTSLEVADGLAGDSDEIRRRLIIEADGTPIGEMSFRNMGDGSAEIGIKICEVSSQNKGYGRLFLSMLINALFRDMGYAKIVLDTNLNNIRAQRVYEKLGFHKIRVNTDAWTDQLDVPQSSIDYELCESEFINFVP